MVKIIKEIKHGIAFMTIMILIAVGLSLVFADIVDGEEVSITFFLFLKLIGFGSVLLSRYIYIKTFEPNRI